MDAHLARLISALNNATEEALRRVDALGLVPEAVPAIEARLAAGRAIHEYAAALAKPSAPANLDELFLELGMAFEGYADTFHERADIAARHRARFVATRAAIKALFFPAEQPRQDVAETLGATAPDDVVKVAARLLCLEARVAGLVTSVSTLDEWRGLHGSAIDRLNERVDLVQRGEHGRRTSKNPLDVPVREYLMIPVGMRLGLDCASGHPGITVWKRLSAGRAEGTLHSRCIVDRPVGAHAAGAEGRCASGSRGVVGGRNNQEGEG